MTKRKYFRKFPKKLLNRKNELKDIKTYWNKRKFSKNYSNKNHFKSLFVKFNNKMLFIFLIFFNRLFNKLTVHYDDQIFTRR
jgi:glutathione synthase/RimK-type ligase-like ATP-grasp enzyme